MSNNKQLHVLCFGDSNTWGYVPGSLNPVTDVVERFEFGKRWSGKIQLQSHHRLQIYEEGLSGRTINIDDPEMPARNGLSSIQMLLDTHEPLNLVILFLGMNDCKIRFSQTVVDMLKGYACILDVIENSVAGVDFESAPEIVMVSYPLPTHERAFDGGFEGATDKLKSLNQGLKKLANERNYLFFDAEKCIKLSDIDGIHFDENAHNEFAKQLLGFLKKHLSF